MKKEQDAKFEGHDDVMGDRYTHPAYGMVSISQVSGKAEIESFVSMTFKNAGIEHFKSEMNLLEDQSEDIT